MTDPLIDDEQTLFDGQVTVREQPIDDGLGYYDEETGAIVIAEDQRRAGKLVVFVHELLHMSETGALNTDVITDRMPEAFVSRTAYFVAEALCEAGVVDVSVDEFRDFAREQGDE